MKATLKIECIGDDTKAWLKFGQMVITEALTSEVARAVVGRIPAGHFVAEITGPDPKYKYRREFLQAKKDYREANSKGSRGVYAWYILESGKIYDVLAPVSRRSSERYFCKVTNQGDIIRITEWEVQEWLKSH